MTLLGAFCIRKATKYKIFKYIYYIISAIFFFYFLYYWNTSFGGVWDNHRQFYFGLFLSWLVFTTILGIYVILELIGRVLCIPFRLKKETKMPSRRQFLSLIGLGIAAIPFAGMLYGMIKGKYNYRVVKHTLFFDNLPSVFDGYRIVHISDIHSGSFDNAEKVQYGIDMINALKADAIFFTGDLVNNKASEIEEWKGHFGQLRAKDGVFSVLGNHDYGDYVQWNTPQEKEENLETLKKIQREMGFHLLTNETAYISRDGYRIAVVGVENWGEDFIKKGDLDEAMKGVPANDFKILLSHDPTHFQQKVISYPVAIPLTLSGHTHGMQFGIEIPGVIEWSPASWRYKYWGGMYEVNGKYINVNRGFGYLAFPGRVGMPPEITLIELKQKEKE
ncbi:MAG: metallophosphoesterase [Capnocytophaga sp.]|nr:metallophosphoesterase [Capnocytophaga sp.]